MKLSCRTRSFSQKEADRYGWSPGWSSFAILPVLLALTTHVMDLRTNTFVLNGIPQYGGSLHLTAA